MLSRSTTTRPSAGSTRSTFPRLPRSRPAMITTVSPFRTCACAIASSDDLGGQRDDLGELLVAELARHRAEDAGAHRVVVGLEEHDRVAVEADVGAVLSPDFLDRPHHHR